MQVGYIIDRPTFQHPADRRRFAWYLRQRGSEPVRAQRSGDYDLFYLSLRCDLVSWTAWLKDYRRRKPHAKVLFELADAYLAEEGGGASIRDIGRGLWNFASGRTRRPVLSYQRLLLEAIDVADVVVCGSPEQRELLLKYHANVHWVTDAFWEDVRVRKTEYEMLPGELHVAWEGMSHGNERVLRRLAEVLALANTGRRTYLHVISDPRLCRYGGRLGCSETTRLLQKIFAGSALHPMFYAWHPATFSAIASRCDIALLPIPDDTLMRLKPENKLLLLWTIGLPVVTEATPAYVRAMQSAGLADYCGSDGDWSRAIPRLLASREARESHARRAAELLEREYSPARLLARWDEVLASVGCPLG